MQKECKECRSDNMPSAPFCEACGYKFPAEWRPDVTHRRLKGHAIAIAVGLGIAIVREVLRRFS
jgi:hypothetical protein